MEKKLKIIYLGHLENNKVRDSDEDIRDALLSLGHEVIGLDDRTFTIKDVLEIKKPDLFLFHKGGVMGDAENFNITLQRLAVILQNLKEMHKGKCKTAFWYPDKVWGNRDDWMRTFVPMVDAGFLVDQTWMRRHNTINLFPLVQGVAPFDLEAGKFNRRYAADIAFVGGTYGIRQVFVEQMKEAYGKKFKVFNDLWEDKWRDACASISLMVAPLHPADDFYWSVRLQRTLGAGQAILHPRLQGMKDLGFVDGKHYLGYSSWKEFRAKLEEAIKPENAGALAKIGKEGQAFVHANFTYKQQLAKLINKVYEKKQ